MKEIFCACGETIYVDEDFPLEYRQKKWSCLGHEGKVVKYSHTYIYNLVLPPLDGFVIDHVDSNPHNNKRSNLRYLTYSQNNMNRKVNRNSQSGLKGVYYDKRRGTYHAYATCNGTRYNLGSFRTAEKAAAAYDVKAIELFGGLATTNFPKQNYE